jgi:hypothetical protein
VSTANLFTDFTQQRTASEFVALLNTAISDYLGQVQAAIMVANDTYISDGEHNAIVFGTNCKFAFDSDSGRYYIAMDNTLPIINAFTYESADFFINKTLPG